jgi:glycosyltransferase involved in cell wall biosynthesis
MGINMPDPKVSIGLPVYNGEKYLAQAIQSALSQTYTDFELIISDNASTDGTQAICEQYAALDPRVRYHRLPENKGATWNFNYTFSLARGEYFCWLAHDDKLMPKYLMEFAAILDTELDTVLAFSNARIIDEHGDFISEYKINMRTDSPRQSQRFYDLLMVWHGCYPIFGLMRASVLRQTALIGAYGFGDQVLLAHLGLMGRFHKVDNPLFISRSHDQQSNRMFNVWVDHHAYDRWFISRNGIVFLPQWEVLYDHLSMVWKAQMSMTERVLCYRAVARWTIRYRRLLFKDISIAFRNLLKLKNFSPAIRSYIKIVRNREGV